MMYMKFGGVWSTSRWLKSKPRNAVIAVMSYVFGLKVLSLNTLKSPRLLTPRMDSKAAISYGCCSCKALSEVFMSDANCFVSASLFK